MANYSETFLSGNTADAAKLVDMLQNDLPSKMGYSQSTGSTFTVNSSTPVTLQSVAVTGVEADEIVEIIASADYVGSVDNDTLFFELMRDSTQVFFHRAEVIAGRNLSVCVPAREENLSGNFTYTWRASRQAGSGSTDVARVNLSVERRKKRA